MSERLRVGAAQLAVFDSRAQFAAGADACWNRVASCLPAVDAHPLDSGDDYAHKTASLELPGLRIGIGLGSAFAFQVDDHPGSSFLLSCGGRAFVRQGDVCLSNSPEIPGLYLPGEAFSCEIRDAHGYLISVRPERLAASALALAEARGMDGVDLSLLQRPLALGPTQAHAAHLLSLLQTTLQLLDHGAGATAQTGGAGPLHRASIADLICRQLVGLLIPDLLEP